MIQPKKINFVIYQGATWEHTFLVLDDVTKLPVTLTDCSARLQARSDPDAVTPDLDITGTVAEVLGQVKFIITPAMTQDKTWETLGYDAELYWGSPTVTKIDKLAYGKMKLQREYTLEP